MERKILEMVWMAELVDKSLASLGFLHDSFLVILTKGSGEFVVVHGWPILNENYVVILMFKKKSKYK